VGRRQE